MGFALLDLLSVNTIEGAELPSVNVDVDGTTSERLLVSAKPPNTQDGAVRSPWFHASPYNNRRPVIECGLIRNAL
jgi:hypothetical protein